MASHRPAARALLAALALLAVAAAPTGRPAPPPARIDLPMASDAESRTETVSRLLADGQWQRACPLLQAMIDENAGVVWDGAAYVPVRDFATRWVAALPGDARMAYEALYGPAARKLLAEGLAERSEPKLREVAERYLNAECGPRAVSALAALRMDRGEFAGALRILRSVEPIEPQSPLGRAIAVRKLVCLARLGRNAEAEELARSLHEAGVDTVEAAGEERAVADLLADALAMGPPPATSAADEPPEDIAAERLSATWTELPWPGGVEPDWPSIPATQPIAWGGLVCVSRDDAVLAVDVETGQLR